MFITAKLVFENYVPDELLKGMWFKQRVKDVIYGKIYEYDKIFELTHIPEYESYIAVNGYPVKPRIMSITANPDESAVTLATAEQIGWWDEDPSSDTMRDIELKDFNVLLEYYDGDVEIEVEYHEDQFGEEFDVQNCVDGKYERPGADLRYSIAGDKLAKLGWKANRQFDREIGKIVEYHYQNWIW